jgi:hypothetical protein
MADGDLGGVGSAGHFDSERHCYASVVKHGEEWRMWYSGNGFGHTGIGYDMRPAWRCLWGQPPYDQSTARTSCMARVSCL